MPITETSFRFDGTLQRLLGGTTLTSAEALRRLVTVELIYGGIPVIVEDEKVRVVTYVLSTKDITEYAGTKAEMELIKDFCDFYMKVRSASGALTKTDEVIPSTVPKEFVAFAVALQSSKAPVRASIIACLTLHFGPGFSDRLSPLRLDDLLEALVMIHTGQCSAADAKRLLLL